MLKKPDFSPAQPWRVETRTVPSKDPADESTGGVSFSPARPELLAQLYPVGLH
jgi:hypothetical protein